MNRQPISHQGAQYHLAPLCYALIAWAGLSFTASAGTPTPATTVTPATAPAPSGIEAWFMQDYMLGDWGGVRTDLAEHGLGFEFFYIGSMPTNFHGGIDEGSEYQHAFLIVADLDTEKAGLWQGGRLHVSAAWLESTDLFSANHVGDFNKSNLVDFPAEFRLWEAYYEQKLLDGRLTLKAGLLAADSDFLLPDYYNGLANINFLNQTFFFPTLIFNLYDVPGFPVGHHALNSSPYGSLGAVLKWDASPRCYVSYGIYDGEPNFDHGTDFSLGGGEGALMFLETGYRWNNLKEDTGRPGAFKIGAFYHTDDFYDVQDAVASLVGLSAGTKTHEGNYGVYMLAEQMLYREHAKDDPAAQGIYSFLRFTGAPADRNLTEFGADAGLVWKGLIPGRDYDTLGLAGSYLRMSDDLRHAQEAINQFAPGAFVAVDYEGAIEVNYKLQLAAWWTVQPSLQYAIHPGGSREIDNAWVFILQTTVRL